MDLDSVILVLYSLLPLLAWWIPLLIGMGVGRYIYADYFKNFEWGVAILLGGPLLTWYLGLLIKGPSMGNLIELPFVTLTISVFSALRGLSLKKRGSANWYFNSCYVIGFIIGLAVPVIPE